MLESLYTDLYYLLQLRNERDLDDPDEERQSMTDLYIFFICTSRIWRVRQFGLLSYQLHRMNLAGTNMFLGLKIVNFRLIDFFRMKRSLAHRICTNYAFCS